MKKKPAQYRNRTRPTILASFILVLSIPLVLLGLSSLQSTDTRSNAQATPTPKCILSFLYVDPSALEINKAVTVQVDGNTTGETIKSVTISATQTGQTAAQIYAKTYATPATPIKETFAFTPTQLGQYSLSGTLVATNAAGANTNYQCLLSGGGAANAMIVPQNALPSFLTQPPTNQQNNIKVGDTYQYQLLAQDTDSWTSFGYSYTFTPRADWLKATVTKEQINSNQGTKLTINFQGIADAPASYLANVIIWDGYNGHTVSQSWIINVGQNQNDIPVVTVSKPTNGTTVTQGQNIDIVWTATDQNQIMSYKLYIASNPGNTATWQPINTNLDFHINKYVLPTDKITPGNYVAIVQAVDSFNPAATGTGTSGTFTISAKPTPPDNNNGNNGNNGGNNNGGGNTDDGRQLKEADITNMKPDDKSTIKNQRPTISATVLAMEGQQVKKDTVILKVDDKDMTSQAELRDVKDGEVSLTYSPKEDLSTGNHKVSISFEDTKGNKVTKDWTFTIEESTDTTEEMIDIFGYKISKRNAIIGGLILLGVLLLVLVVPWIIYGAFRKKDDDQYYQTYSSYKPSPVSPTVSGTTGGSNVSSYYNYQPDPIAVTEPTVVTEPTDTQPTATTVTSTEITNVEPVPTTNDVAATSTYTPAFVPMPYSVTTTTDTTTTQPQITPTYQAPADQTPVVQPASTTTYTPVNDSVSTVYTPVAEPDTNFQSAYTPVDDFTNATQATPQPMTSATTSTQSVYEPIQPSQPVTDVVETKPVERILYEAPDSPTIINVPVNNTPESPIEGSNNAYEPLPIIPKDQPDNYQTAYEPIQPVQEPEIIQPAQSVFSQEPPAEQPIAFTLPGQPIDQGSITQEPASVETPVVQPQVTLAPSSDTPTSQPFSADTQLIDSVYTPIAEEPATSTPTVSDNTIPASQVVTTTPYTPATFIPNDQNQAQNITPAVTTTTTTTVTTAPLQTPQDNTVTTTLQNTDETKLDSATDTSYPVEDEVEDSEADAIRQLADELEKQYGQMSSNTIVDQAIVSGGQVTAPSPTNPVVVQQNNPPTNPV